MADGAKQICRQEGHRFPMITIGQIPVYFWALPFATAAGMTVLIERLCIRWSLYDYPGERKMQKIPVPRMGGLAFFIAPLACGLAFSLAPPWELLVGSLLVFLGGMYDDLKPSNTVMNKLVFQIPAALIFAVFTDLSYLHPSPMQAFVTRVLIFMLLFFLTNAANLMDNMNGLTAGLAVITLAGLAFLAHDAHDSSLSTLGILLALSLAGFYIRNYPFGKIYMGDQGSQFLGFFMPAYALLVVPRASSGEFVTVFINTAGVLFFLFALFLFDVVTVVRIRLKEGRSPFQGDQCHVSHRLVKRGFSPALAVLMLTGVQAVLTLLALAVAGLGSLGTTL